MQHEKNIRVRNKWNEMMNNRLKKRSMSSQDANYSFSFFFALLKRICSLTESFIRWDPALVHTPTYNCFLCPWTIEEEGTGERNKTHNAKHRTPNEWSAKEKIISYFCKAEWSMKTEIKRNRMKRNWKMFRMELAAFFCLRFATSTYCCEIMSVHAQDIFRMS